MTTHHVRSFPPELWRMVFDNLQDDEAYRTMAHLVQCSKYLRDIGQPVLYSTFSTGSILDHSQLPEKSVSLVPFFRAVALSSTLAKFVTVVEIGRIRDIPRNLDEDLLLIQDVAQRLGFRVGRSRRHLTGQEQVKFMFEVLPCLLPNLKALRLGISERTPETRFEHYLKYWAKLSPNNRLWSLTSITVSDNFSALYALTNMSGLLRGVAPNTRYIRLCMPYNYSEPGEIFMPGISMDFQTGLGRLNELYIDDEFNDHGWAMHLLRHCKQLESFTCRENHPTNIRHFCGVTFGGRPLPPPAVVSSSIRELTKGRANCRQTYENMCKYLKASNSLKLVKLSQGAIPYDVEGTSGALENILPSSLKALHLLEVDRDLYRGIYDFAQDCLSEKRPNLVEIVISISTKKPDKVLSDADQSTISGMFAAAGVRCAFTKA
ncbi:hypothetical protein AAE478_006118 [Parahypoxylon ruwenzoriense]